MLVKDQLGRYLLVLFACISAPVLWSQTSLELGQTAFENQEFETAARYFQSALQVAHADNNPSLDVIASKSLADALLFLNEMDSAYQIVNKTISLAEEIGDTLSLIELINWKSEFLYMNGHFNERIAVYQPIAQHLENYKDGHEALYAEVFAAYGSLLFIKDRNKSISYINKSLALSTKINDRPKIAYAHNHLATIYLRENNLAKAIAAGIEASKYTIDNSPSFQGAVYLNIARCLINVENFKKAKVYLDLANEHITKYKLTRLTALNNLIYAELFHSTGEDQLYEEYLSKAEKSWTPKFGLDFQVSTKSLQLRHFIRENKRDSVIVKVKKLEKLNRQKISPQSKTSLIHALSNAYLYLGMREKAFQFYTSYASSPETYLHSGDSLLYYSFLTKYYEQKKDVSQHLFHLKKKRALSEQRKEQNRISNIYLLEDEYQQAEKERQISQMENLNNINSIELSNRNKLLGVLSAFVAILGFLGFYIFKRNKQIKEQHKTIKENETANKVLLSEIHGRVKESLQTISSLLHMQARDLKNEDAKLAIMEGRNRINSMALIHDHLFLENNQDKIQIKDYFDQLLDYILLSYTTTEREILLEKEINIEKMPLEQVAAIGLIVNELVSNSLKHAFSGRSRGLLKVGFNENDGYYTLSIADNGIGIDPNSKRIESGFGSKIIQAFSKKLKANLEQMDGSGTTTILKFPKMD